MPLCDPQCIPLLWINLDRAILRRTRMEWAIREGGWDSYRFSAVDAEDPSQVLFAIPNFFHSGTHLPGVYLADELNPNRRTTRAELACAASWKRLLQSASSIDAPIGWFLLMEDDLGSSLSVSDSWVHSLVDLIQRCPSNTLAIQLAPISCAARQSLYRSWLNSRGQCLALPKELIRSHGNGAVLLHKNALSYLIDHFSCICASIFKSFHPIVHPWRVRPVADKWIYAALPPGSCQVATYPHFCLDASESSLHSDHVLAYHKPSRDLTLKLWESGHNYSLLNAQRYWDTIN